jgi:hypothetical protein
MTDNPDNTRRNGRNTDGTFATGNPGRPKNARNLATRAMEELLDGEGETITRKCIELAKNGDLGAIRLVLERVLPVRKDRIIQVDIPSVKSLDDVAIALQSVVEAVGAGELSPSEGATFSGLLQTILMQFVRNSLKNAWTH